MCSHRGVACPDGDPDRRDEVDVGGEVALVSGHIREFFGRALDWERPGVVERCLYTVRPLVELTTVLYRGSTVVVHSVSQWL